ncbi:diacylglycerol kinase [Falsirhodobacter halotolerans]|uniref:diacylglycerol kinase n=1 Tax=Falsirhodobacter halotolerans TaxID=1146892 RepID=UPI001FD2E097|nr:diacylglycerol kinase [Falsirhodobacter halotolerans]MCJ8140072.1 diacylglycerol kinase [Falsirhodobacter halotolerans]
MTLNVRSERPSKPRPPRETGLRHLLAAGTYTLAGARRLARETAARHEMAIIALGIASLLATGASARDIGGFCILSAVLLAMEAMNTAIEVLTDHVSPEWSEPAKQAKDLGSLACGLLIAVVVAYWGIVMFF